MNIQPLSIVRLIPQTHDSRISPGRHAQPRAQPARQETLATAGEQFVQHSFVHSTDHSPCRNGGEGMSTSPGEPTAEIDGPWFASN